MHRVLRFSFIFIVLLGTSAQANDLKSAVIKCKNVKDSLERLVCYDRMAKEVDSLYAASFLHAQSPKPAVVPSIIEKTAKELPQIKQQKSEREFGLEHKSIKDEKVASKIYSDIRAIKTDPYGKLQVTLENGQVWKQIDSSSIRIKVGQTVYVERALFGSFFMSMDSVNRRIKVKRVK